MGVIEQAIILAGGRGTRLRPLTDRLPKPMAPVNGKPFLEYLVELLRQNGVQEIVLLLGYLPEKIRDHFGDGSRYGVKISYSVTRAEDETGARLSAAAPLVRDTFLLLYGDNYWPLRLDPLFDFYQKKNTIASVAVYTNKDRQSRNNMRVDEDGYVTVYDPLREVENLNGVEIGFFLLKKKVFSYMPGHNFSFEKEVLPVLIKERELAGFRTDHPYYSIGTMEKLERMRRALRPKKVIFLDRDGIINKKPPPGEYVKSWNEFEFLPGAKRALRMLAEKGYAMYIVTNQAGIGRGMMTHRDLDEIHARLAAELEQEGVHLGGVYYCPHGWDEGCECRKPKSGMLYQAAREHDFDLTKTIFIGDDARDMEAGNGAGCLTFLTDETRGVLEIASELA